MKKYFQKILISFVYAFGLIPLSGIASGMYSFDCPNPVKNGFYDGVFIKLIDDIRNDSIIYLFKDSTTKHEGCVRTNKTRIHNVNTIYDSFILRRNVTIHVTGEFTISGIVIHSN